MNLQDKPVDQIRDAARLLNETVQNTSPPSPAQWEEMRYDLGNVAIFLETFTIPALENPIVRHEYKTVVPRPTDRRVATFGRGDEEYVAQLMNKDNGNS